MPNEQTPQKQESKTATIQTLLRRKHGATLTDLAKATGRQPHSVRAALTGLRKKGVDIEKTRRDDATCYHIADSAR